MNDYAAIIKSTLTMRDVATFYGYIPNRSGFICCPLHNEKTPSLKLYPDDRGWWCHGCNVGGSVIDFIMHTNLVDFKTATKQLNSDFKLGLDLEGNIDGAVLKRHRDERRAKQEHKTRIETEWGNLCTEHRRLWRNFIDYKPRSQDIQPHKLFIEALQKLGYIRYRIEVIEDEWRKL